MEITQVNGQDAVDPQDVEAVASDPVSDTGDLPASDEAVTDEALVDGDPAEDPPVGDELSDGVMGSAYKEEPAETSGEEVRPDEESEELEGESDDLTDGDLEEGGEGAPVPDALPPSPVYTEESPLPVLVVEPEDVEEEAFLYSVSGSPYPGTISTGYLDYFAGIAQKLSYKEHYMAFRSGQYEYYMVWGEDLEYDGVRFRGSALSYCRIYTGSGSSSMTVTYGSDTFYLTPGTGLVYSDLERFALLTEGGTHLESLTLLFAVGFAVVYSVCHDLFDYVMQHVYRKSG